jgi:hypothetical protein
MTYKYATDGDNIRVDVVDDRSNLAWAIFDRRGNPIKFCAESFIMHWDHNDDNMIAGKIKSFASAPFDCDVYVRFNNLPKNGKSKNYATGCLERGISVYAARYDLVSGEYQLCGSGLAGALIAYTIKGAPVYFVSGMETGKGSDGEPLLKNVKILSRAKMTDNGGYTIC